MPNTRHIWYVIEHLLHCNKYINDRIKKHKRRFASDSLTVAGFSK